MTTGQQLGIVKAAIVCTWMQYLVQFLIKQADCLSDSGKAIGSSEDARQAPLAPE
eukprot:CAMPEP_0169293824 /NCGR_PEP_ID=MMETSP1016-20121227/63515_1 /TAXON_ID=342587 /ORGANISM="Karlodinium micrum, Strain CCMP2283" /LENGTH=54 /DNA_ID=CAMNT_0009384579 /DNA_START=109 /DNA_END=270 /DNA_ORIENTATION=+